MVGERWRADADTGRLESARELVLVLTLVGERSTMPGWTSEVQVGKGGRWTKATLRELITLIEEQEGQDLNYAVSL